MRRLWLRVSGRSGRRHRNSDDRTTARLNTDGATGRPGIEPIGARDEHDAPSARHDSPRSDCAAGNAGHGQPGVVASTGAGRIAFRPRHVDRSARRRAQPRGDVVLCLAHDIADFEFDVDNDVDIDDDDDYHDRPVGGVRSRVRRRGHAGMQRDQRRSRPPHRSGHAMEPGVVEGRTDEDGPSTRDQRVHQARPRRCPCPSGRRRGSSARRGRLRVLVPDHDAIRFRLLVPDDDTLRIGVLVPAELTWI